MNIKHTKLLRMCHLHYIARVINETPSGMAPALGEVQRAAGQLQAMVLELWPKLTHKQRGKVVHLMMCDMAALNVIARMVVSMCERKANV